MGLFDSIKKTLGRSEPEADVTTSPSQLLREAGLDPSGLTFGFGMASITVGGTIADESERQKIIDVLTAIPGINHVHDDMAAADSPVPEPEAPAATPAASQTTAAGEAVTRTYTVVSGDTLWKIAERTYGNGSRYMKIFEANTDILEHPDRIFPGQKLVIPD